MFLNTSKDFSIVAFLKENLQGWRRGRWHLGAVFGLLKFVTFSFAIKDEIQTIPKQTVIQKERKLDIVADGKLITNCV